MTGRKARHEASRGLKHSLHDNDDDDNDDNDDDDDGGGGDDDDYDDRCNRFYLRWFCLLPVGKVVGL